MKILSDLVLSAYFDSTFPIIIILRIAFFAGLWQIFKKSGLKGWWALIPCAREYQLARCAGREPEGRIYALSKAVIMVMEVIIVIFGLESELENDIPGTLILFLVIEITFMMIHFIFNLRVFAGLIEVYGVSKHWLWLCVFDDTVFIPALVFGFNKNYQPRWKIEDMRAEMERLTTSGSVDVLAKGLTVNLKERTVNDFFRKKTLLRDINLSIPTGHMVLLLGGSGAGKTTFLNAVNGYEKADAEVMLSGVNMYTEYKKMQYEVGFVPQSEMMNEKDTVLNTLLDTAALRLPMDTSHEQRRKRVDEVMEMFGLEPLKDELVEKLSGGQKKRLSISMEIISNPSLFILDEPDSGLDGVMARELFLQLRKIADTGKIVIVITHTPDRVIDLFDDVIVLAKDSTQTGRLAWYGSIKGARKFFGRDSMEEIVKSVNSKEEGGDGRADEFVMKYAEEKYA